MSFHGERGGNLVLLLSVVVFEEAARRKDSRVGVDEYAGSLDWESACLFLCLQ